MIIKPADATPGRGRLDERDVWIIAYPDHVTAPGRTPLQALDAFVRDVLQPFVTGCHVLPIHPSSSDGGFSVIDAAAVDDRFGSWDDVRHLATTCTWMADAVVNHMSVQSEWFRAFLDGEAPFDRYFVTLDPGADTTSVIRPRTSPLTHPFRKADGSVVHVWTTFSSDQADLDYTNPDVLAAMTDVLLRYVEAGAGAIRLDAIAFVGKDATTSSINRPETHAVVRAFRSALEAAAPDVLLVTETNVPHRENIAYLAPGEADAVYQFALPPLVAYTLLAQDSGPLCSWLNTIDDPPPPKLFLNFLASHDGVGLRPVEGILDGEQIALLAGAAIRAGGVVNWRTTPAADELVSPYELAVSWFALMAAGCDDDEAVARHAASHAIAVALRGLPLLYLNSLFGVGNDDETYGRTGHGRDLNRGRLTRDEIDRRLADDHSVAARVWREITRMLAVRRSSAAFHPASEQIVHDVGSRAVMIERRAGNGERALVVVNVSGEPLSIALADGRWVDGDGAAQPAVITVDPWASRWLVGAT